MTSETNTVHDVTITNLWEMRTAKAVFIQNFVTHFFADLAASGYQVEKMGLSYFTISNSNRDQYAFAFAKAEEAWNLFHLK